MRREVRAHADCLLARAVRHRPLLLLLLLLLLLPLLLLLLLILLLLLLVLVVLLILRTTNTAYATNTRVFGRVRPWGRRGAVSFSSPRCHVATR